MSSVRLATAASSRLGREPGGTPEDRQRALDVEARLHRSWLAALGPVHFEPIDQPRPAIEIEKALTCDRPRATQRRTLNLALEPDPRRRLVKLLERGLHRAGFHSVIPGERNHRGFRQLPGPPLGHRLPGKEVSQGQRIAQALDQLKLGTGHWAGRAHHDHGGLGRALGHEQRETGT